MRASLACATALLATTFVCGSAWGELSQAEWKQTLRELQVTVADGDFEAASLAVKTLAGDDSPRAARTLVATGLQVTSSKVYQAVLESIASEHAARMVAMGSAHKNAGEMIDRLVLTRNRLRQATITKEIAEIVGGAEALT